jgi:hypothetical protein
MSEEEIKHKLDDFKSNLLNNLNIILLKDEFNVILKDIETEIISYSTPDKYNFLNSIVIEWKQISENVQNIIDSDRPIKGLGLNWEYFRYEFKKRFYNELYYLQTIVGQELSGKWPLFNNLHEEKTLNYIDKELTIDEAVKYIKAYFEYCDQNHIFYSNEFVDSLNKLLVKKRKEVKNIISDSNEVIEVERSHALHENFSQYIDEKNVDYQFLMDICNLLIEN